jgi:hypothetical protein
MELRSGADTALNRLMNCRAVEDNQQFRHNVLILEAWFCAVLFFL